MIHHQHPVPFFTAPILGFRVLEFRMSAQRGTDPAVAHVKGTLDGPI